MAEHVLIVDRLAGTPMDTSGQALAAPGGSREGQDNKSRLTELPLDQAALKDDRYDPLRGSVGSVRERQAMNMREKETARPEEPGRAAPICQAARVVT